MTEHRLYAERHADGRAFDSAVSPAGGDGLVIHNRRTGADGEVSEWSRSYDAAEVAMVVVLLDGDADALDDPAAWLGRLAAAGELPTDQTLDDWLADHGVPGRRDS